MLSYNTFVVFAIDVHFWVLLDYVIFAFFIIFHSNLSGPQYKVDFDITYIFSVNQNLHYIQGLLYFFFNLDMWAIQIECLPKKSWEVWQIWGFKIQDGRQNQVYLIYLPRCYLFYIRVKIEKLQHINLYAHTKFRSKIFKN